MIDELELDLVLGFNVADLDRRAQTVSRTPPRPVKAPGVTIRTRWSEHPVQWPFLGTVIGELDPDRQGSVADLDRHVRDRPRRRPRLCSAPA